MTDKKEEINQFLLSTMYLWEIEDTTENRIELLQGLYDTWNEGEPENLDHILYKQTLNAEIFNLKLKLKFPNFWK